VIAFGYTEHIDRAALLVAVVLFAALFAVRWLNASWRGPVAVALGVGIWLAMFESGVDAVISGLAIGLISTACTHGRRA
jgi:Na+/H+ antiporter NhaA